MQVRRLGCGPGEFRGESTGKPGITILKLPVVDVAAAYGSELLYATVGSPAAQFEHSLIAVDPVSAEVLWALPISGSPGVIGLSDDGGTAWVGLRETTHIVQIDLSSRSEIARYAVNVGGYDGNYPYDIELLPGSSTRLFLSTTHIPGIAGYGGLGLLDNGQQVGTAPAFPEVDEVTVATTATAYALDTGSTAATLANIDISDTGYTFGQITMDFVDDFAKNLTYDGEYLVVDSGQVIDPATHTLVGRYGQSGRLWSNRVLDRTYIVTDPINSGIIEIGIWDRDAFSQVGQLSLDICCYPRVVTQSEGGTLAIAIDSDSSRREADYWLVLVSPSALGP